MDVVESTGRLAGGAQAGGCWDRLRGMLLRLLGGDRPAAVVRSRPIPIEVEDDDPESFVVAPGGYRIRIPDPGDVGHSVGEVLPHVRAALAAVPPLPHVVVELLKEVQDHSSTAASVAAVAASDPALAAALLRTVNSAAFGLNRKVTSVADAVNYLGFAMVKSIVVRLRLDQVLPRGTPKTAAAAEDLWVHSLAVSYVADCLAERVPDVDRGLASTLGLLHDIGKLAILARLGDQPATAEGSAPVCGAQAGGAQAGGARALHAQSREALSYGADHAGIGANLAHRWGLPADLVQAIRWHHHPEQAFEPNDPPALRKAVYLVQVANQLAKYGFAYADDMELDAGAAAACEALSLGKSVEKLMDAKVRAAVTRAILFAAENAAPAAAAPRPFLRLRAGAAAAALAADPCPSPRVHVDEEGVSAALSLAAPFDLKSGASLLSAKALASASRARFIAPATVAGIAKLTAAVLEHQRELRVSPASSGPAAVTLRALLANLVDPDARGATIEVSHGVDDGGRLSLAVRADALSIARRLAPADPDAGRRLVDRELANVLNLDWFRSITITPDGSAWLFAGH